MTTQQSILFGALPVLAVFALLFRPLSRDGNLVTGFLIPSLAAYFAWYAMTPFPANTSEGLAMALVPVTWFFLLLPCLPGIQWLWHKLHRYLDRIHRKSITAKIAAVPGYSVRFSDYSPRFMVLRNGETVTAAPQIVRWNERACASQVAAALKTTPDNPAGAQDAPTA